MKHNLFSIHFLELSDNILRTIWRVVIDNVALEVLSFTKCLRFLVFGPVVPILGHLVLNKNYEQRDAKPRQDRNGFREIGTRGFHYLNSCILKLVKSSVC